MSSLPYSSAPLFAVRCVLLQFRVARHPPYALAYLISWFSLFLQCAFFKIFFFRKLFFSYCFLSVFFLHNLLQDLFSICCVFSSNLCLRFSKIELWRTILQNLIELFPRLYTFSNYFLLRKEVIHPHVPVGIPCYDLTPVISPAFDGSLLFLGYATGFGHYRLPWFDGRCVQGPRTYSPQHADLRLLAIPAS